MLIVPSYVSRSSIQGLGVFAAEPIAKGDLVWEFNQTIDVEIDMASILALPTHVGELALLRSFKTEDGGKIILSRDNGVFLNHSDSPNTTNLDGNLYASKAIKVGEEITENYRLLPPHTSAFFLRDESEPVVTQACPDPAPLHP